MIQQEMFQLLYSN